MIGKSVNSVTEYTRKHCKHKLYDEDYVKKVVAVKKKSLVLEFQEPKFQLQFVTLTKPPKIFAGMVACVSLYSGNVCYFRGEDILGIVHENYLPEWAVQNREELTMLLP